eukprot:1406097-Amphidinium_carterae.1
MDQLHARFASSRVNLRITPSRFGRAPLMFHVGSDACVFQHIRRQVEGLEGTSAKVLHYFGQGGSGWTVMYGCAREGVDMLESSFSSEL